MDTNNDQNEKNFQVPSREELNRIAATNYRREKVEAIYAGQTSFDTPQTKPVVQNRSVDISTNSLGNRLNVDSASLQESSSTPAKPAIQPINNKQNIVKTNESNGNLGAVDYRPRQNARNIHRQSQDDQASEQWRRYHAAWQNYYQKYYESYYNSALAQQKKVANIQPETIEEITDSQKKTRALAKLRQNISEKARQQSEKIRKSRHFVPIVSALTVVSVFLFLQYNRLIFATVEAYVAPGNASPQQIIQAPNTDGSVGSDPRLIIPKINVDVPVIYGVGNDGKSQLEAMNRGVAHFAIPGANSVPGQIGNTVLSGHSSNDLFDSGDYKFIFAQLEKLEKGDVIYANYQGKRYSYVVKNKRVVLPSEVKSLIYPTDKPILTLITCTPLGTAEKRLLVEAEQVSPDPSDAKPQTAQSETDVSSTTELPRNSLTFFERLLTWNWK